MLMPLKYFWVYIFIYVAIATWYLLFIIFIISKFLLMLISYLLQRVAVPNPCWALFQSYAKGLM